MIEDMASDAMLMKTHMDTYKQYDTQERTYNGERYDHTNEFDGHSYNVKPYDTMNYDAETEKLDDVIQNLLGENIGNDRPPSRGAFTTHTGKETRIYK